MRQVTQQEAGSALYAAITEIGQAQLEMMDETMLLEFVNGFLSDQEIGGDLADDIIAQIDDEVSRIEWRDDGLRVVVLGVLNLYLYPIAIGTRKVRA
jgi:hypothetical protein